MSATQPISLITATPGGGKTALAVQLMQAAVKAGRPLFVMGIPELRLPYIPTPPIAEWTEMREDPENPGMMLPYFTFPENSLIVLDEAQRVYRPRPAASKIPDHVAAFETVRHTGVTFLLITQNPSFLDGHIRKLVGSHVHLRDVGVLGRYYYEWPEVGNPENYSTAPIKKKWSLPKSSFGMYKSSSMHIKRKYSFPPVLMLLLVGLAIGGYLIYRTVGAIGSKIAPEVAPASGDVVKVPTGAVPVAPLGAAMTGADYFASFVPVAAGRPESAPIYAALRQVKDMPRVDGCIATIKRCSCYTQQGTDAGLDEGQCRAWLERPAFDPYREPARAVEALQRVDGRLPLSGASTEETLTREIPVISYKPGRVGDGAKEPQVGGDSKVSR